MKKSPSNNPFKHGPKFDLTVCCFIFGLLILAGIYATHLLERRPLPNVEDSMKVALLKKAPLYIKFGTSEDSLKLQKGDTVCILASKSDGPRDMLTFLVETESGQRGYVAQDAVCNRGVVFEGGAKGDLDARVGDTVDIVSCVNVAHRNVKYKVRFAGEDTLVTLTNDNLVTTLASEMADLELDDYRRYISIKKLRRVVAEQPTMMQLDSILGDAPEYVVNTPRGKVAAYRLKAFDDATGGMRYPFFFFNKEGHCDSMNVSEPKKASGFFLRYAPYAAEIIDAAHVLIDEPRFEKTSRTSLPAFLFWIWAIIKVAFALLMGLLWWSLPGLVPVLLLTGLVRLRLCYFPLPNKLLLAMLMAVGVGGIYCWTVLLSAWGLWWWVSMLAQGFMLMVYYFLIADLLTDNIPRCRCSECRTLYSIVPVGQELDHTEKVWRKKKDRGSVLDRYTKRWQTWTQYTQGDRSWREDVQNHSATVTTYEMHNYNVLYEDQYYNDYFECQECGHREQTTSTKSVPLKSEYVGSHTETVTT